MAGYYQAGAPGNSATSHAIVGAAGEVYLVVATAEGADAGRGVIDATGALALTTERNVQASGAVDGPAATVLATFKPAGGSGAYTAIVRGQNDATGVSLIEVYDATEGEIPRSRRTAAQRPVVARFDSRDDEHGAFAAQHLRQLRATLLRARERRRGRPHAAPEARS